MLTWLKDHFVDVKVAEKLPPEKLEGKFMMGEFKKVDQIEYTDAYQQIIDRFAAKENK